MPTAALARLLRAFGSPDGVLRAAAAARRRVVGDAASALERSAPTERIDATLAWLEQPQHHLIAWDDDDYPAALLTIPDPPAVLFGVGRRERLAQPAFAIVGSRNATPQGCEDARAFAQTLSEAGLTIVSGMALGVDAAAHRGGLAGPASSIAVMGTGPDRVYPARNRDLAHALAHSGLIVTEFEPGAPPLAHHFPRRNRVISGLARGLLVVEATLSSGSLITARLAGEQGREVFAIPGSIHSPFSKGCHKLIREGAKLVETAQDILEELGMPAPTLSSLQPASAPDARGARVADPVLRAIGTEVIDMDTLLDRTGLSIGELQAQLAALELDGVVAVLPGGRWQRVM